MVKSALAFIEITQHPDDSLQSNEVLTHLCRCPIASKMRNCMISTPFQGKKKAKTVIFQVINGYP